MASGRLRLGAMVMALAMAGTGLTSVPAAAQSNDQDARIRQLEAEVRALQRKVFPGPEGKYFTPEVVTPTPGAQQAVPGTPSTSAMTDMLGRLDSLEAQIARLTSQTEVNSNAIAELTMRLDALAPPSPAPSTTPPPASTELPTVPQSAQLAPAQRSGEILPSKPAPAPAAAPPSSARIAAVQAVPKPQTDDPGEDDYTYGFRLWDAKFYPEAEQQLRLFLDKYPSHWRTSYARNLLGRAYLDDGKPREAAPWFLQNYQNDKQGARAGDSLLFLAEAMIAIKDTNRACIALAEFAETYPALATGRLSDQYAADRSKVKCN